MKISQKSKTLRKQYICNVQGEYDNRDVRQKVGKIFISLCMSCTRFYLHTHQQYNIFIRTLSCTYMNSLTNNLHLKVRTYQKTLIEIRFKYVGKK